MKKIVKLLLIAITLSLLVSGCGEKKQRSEKLLGIDYSTSGNEVSLDNYETDNPVVSMYIENYGSVVMELYPDKAPNTVNNFISLVKSGFYDNNTFHRLMPEFVLQGGDPDGLGTGGPGYSIKGEFLANGYEKNDLKHEKWIVSMARSREYDSAGSQFFIMLGTASHLDSEYAAFGEVIDGKDIIEEIEDNEKVADYDTGKLQTNLKIKKSLVDLKGKDYPDVLKIEEN